MANLCRLLTTGFLWTFHFRGRKWSMISLYWSVSTPFWSNSAHSSIFVQILAMYAYFQKHLRLTISSLYRPFDTKFLLRPVLCSSRRTYDQRTAAEPNDSRLHRNGASSIEIRTAQKWHIGSAVMSWRCKTRSKVPSGVQATRTLTGTNALLSESRL